MRPPPQFVRVAGRQVAVEDAGPASGFPVIVHHGGTRHLFPAAVRDARAHGLRLISYDRPGYGGSTAQPGRSVADCASDVRTIADAFGVDRLAVWGASGGGPHALACAALLPDLVCAVASIASLAPYGAPDLDYFTGMGQANVDDIKLFLDDPAAAREKSMQDRQDVLSRTPETVHTGLASLLSPADAAVLTYDMASFFVSSAKDGLAPGDQGWWDDGCAHMGPWGFELDAIRIPVQLWHGAQDRFVPFQHGQWLAAHIAGVDAHLTEGDGHLTLLVERVPDVHNWLLQHT